MIVGGTLRQAVKSGPNVHSVDVGPNRRDVTMSEPQQVEHAVDEVVDEVLVEDVSIDGMCGVY